MKLDEQFHCGNYALIRRISDSIQKRSREVFQWRFFSLIGNLLGVQSEIAKGMVCKMERRSQESFVDLVDSGQFLTAEEMFSERRTDDPLEVVIRSEVAMYFGKLNEAQNLLEQIKDRVSDINVAARFSLSKGRLALRLDDDEQAAPLLQSAYFFYLFNNAPFGISQSLIELAKLARRAARFEEAAEKLTTALEKLEGRTGKKIDFLRGIIASERGALLAEQGEIDEAAKAYEEAAGILKVVERGRYYAYALLGTAGLKYSTGEF